MAEPVGVMGPMLDDLDPDLLAIRQIKIGYKDPRTPYEKLPPKRQRIVDAYVMDPSSFPNAVVAAGYSQKAVHNTSSQFFNEPLMQAAIAEKMGEREERTMVTADRILHELAVIGFSDLRNYTINPDTGNISLPRGMPEYVMRAVSSIKFVVTVEEDGTTRKTLEFKLWDKLQALRLMGQHLAMFTDKIQLTTGVDVRQKWLVGGKEIVF